jgi:hypothetical protein
VASQPQGKHEAGRPGADDENIGGGHGWSLAGETATEASTIRQHHGEGQPGFNGDESMTPSQYENAAIVKSWRDEQPDGGELQLSLLAGEGPAIGHYCIHRVAVDMAGRLRSDIVYFYEPGVDQASIEDDFALLTKPGLMSISQLHHTASMLNRGARTPRHA